MKHNSIVLLQKKLAAVYGVMPEWAFIQQQLLHSSPKPVHTRSTNNNISTISILILAPNTSGSLWKGDALAPREGWPLTEGLLARDLRYNSLLQRPHDASHGRAYLYRRHGLVAKQLPVVSRNTGWKLIRAKTQNISLFMIMGKRMRERFLTGISERQEMPLHSPNIMKKRVMLN